MSIYKLYASVAATADGIASLDIQFDGVITAIDWTVTGDLDADLEAYIAEVSFLSTNTLSANDSRGSLSQVGERAAGTPGFVVSRSQKTVSGLRVPVSAGERMYMHASLTGSGSMDATCYLHVEDTSDPRLRRRR